MNQIIRMLRRSSAKLVTSCLLEALTLLPSMAVRLTRPERASSILCKNSATTACFRLVASTWL